MAGNNPLPPESQDSKDLRDDIRAAEIKHKKLSTMHPRSPYDTLHRYENKGFTRYALGGMIDRPAKEPKPYQNDIPKPKPKLGQSRVPESWMPPGEDYNPPPPPRIPGGKPPIRLKRAPTIRLPAKRPGAVPETET